MMQTHGTTRGMLARMWQTFFFDYDYLSLAIYSPSDQPEGQVLDWAGGMACRATRWRSG